MVIVRTHTQAARWMVVGLDRLAGEFCELVFALERPAGQKFYRDFDLKGSVSSSFRATATEASVSRRSSGSPKKLQSTKGRIVSLGVV